MSYVPCYIFGPLLGGFVGGMFHKWIHENAISNSEAVKDPEYDAINN